eukprot:5151354-Prymnesium_polylepis.1
MEAAPCGVHHPAPPGAQKSGAMPRARRVPTLVRSRISARDTHTHISYLWPMAYESLTYPYVLPVTCTFWVADGL